MAPDHDGFPFVVQSELRVTVEGTGALETAFADRLGLVEDHDGFGGLEVWRDERVPTRFVMVSWWRDRQAFLAYLRSDDHARSHARIDTGPDGPRPVALSRYRVVAR